MASTYTIVILRSLNGPFHLSEALDVRPPKQGEGEADVNIGQCLINVIDPMCSEKSRTRKRSPIGADYSLRLCLPVSQQPVHYIVNMRINSFRHKRCGRRVPNLNPAH